MKIVFINNDIYKYALGDPLAVGGAERQQWLLARALARTGWVVKVGVSNALTIGKETLIDGVEFSGIGRGRGHVLSAWRRFLKLEQPEWWYWRCATHLLGPAFAIARFQGIRTIFSAALDPDVNPHRALFLRTRWWPLYAWGLSWADRIFVQHGGQLAEIRSNWRSKTCIVPSIAGEAPCVKPHSQRQKYVAWIGQLKELKRPDLLIEMARQSSSVRFVVCGGPSTFMSQASYSQKVIDALRTLPNVEYRGQVPPQNAAQVIAEAAILLSTSDEEGFPNTFLQAWASGTPVVSLKIDPDQIIDKRNLGVVCGTTADAVASMETLLALPARREAIATRARRYVAENHSQEAVTAVFNRAVQDHEPVVQRVLC